MKILIMGLPGTGKTWLSDHLQTNLRTSLFDSYDVRLMADDLDYSKEGRLRHARRMAAIATFESGWGRTVIVNSVCPRIEMRAIIDPDVLIWMDTFEGSKDPNTNRMFQPLTNTDCKQRIVVRKRQQPSDVAKIAQRIEQQRWDKL